jgi:catechol 2,3-dioxygenase-like lactoylglutathione lyase family enzyme
MFRVLQIDHVELFVPDRYEAARWYESVLGLRVLPEFEMWAAGSGPLMVSSDEGSTKLALFEGRPDTSASIPSGFRRVAFRVDADGFLAFLNRLPDLHLSDAHGRGVTADLVVDHQKAYSIYFVDPYGHLLEVTTYDYAPTRHGLARLQPARNASS